MSLLIDTATGKPVRHRAHAAENPAVSQVVAKGPYASTPPEAAAAFDVFCIWQHVHSSLSPVEAAQPAALEAEGGVLVRRLNFPLSTYTASWELLERIAAAHTFNGLQELLKAMRRGNELLPLVPAQYRPQAEAARRMAGAARRSGKRGTAGAGIGSDLGGGKKRKRDASAQQAGLGPNKQPRVGPAPPSTAPLPGAAGAAPQAALPAQPGPQPASAAAPDAAQLAAQVARSLLGALPGDPSVGAYLAVFTRMPAALKSQHADIIKAIAGATGVLPHYLSSTVVLMGRGPWGGGQGRRGSP